MYCDACKDDRDFIEGMAERTVEIKDEPVTVIEPVLMCFFCHAVQPDLKRGCAIELAARVYEEKHGKGTSGIRGLTGEKQTV